MMVCDSVVIVSDPCLVNNEQVSAEPKKIGTKKQRKLAEKAEKKALREVF